jgi:hypothetical protein
MTQINPFTGAIVQGTQVQQRQGAEKERHIRRLQNLGKNAALQGDRLEHQVESADALPAINDQGTSNNPRRRSPQRPATPKKPGPNDEPEHIDLTA